jgi:hypothetical protein
MTQDESKITIEYDDISVSQAPHDNMIIDRNQLKKQALEEAEAEIYRLRRMQEDLRSEGKIKQADNLNDRIELVEGEIENLESDI